MSAAAGTAPAECIIRACDLVMTGDDEDAILRCIAVLSIRPNQ